MSFAYSDPITLTVGTSLQVRLYAGLTITGIVGSTNRIEATPNLYQTNSWTALTNLVLPASPYFWVDPESASVPRRFYRSVVVP